MSIYRIRSMVSAPVPFGPESWTATHIMPEFWMEAESKEKAEALAGKIIYKSCTECPFSSTRMYITPTAVKVSRFSLAIGAEKLETGD